MPILPTPDSVNRTLADLERRLRELEQGNRLGNSGITDGALIARDSSGTEKARFGRLTDGTWGVTGRFVGAEVSGSSITGGTIDGAVVTGGTVKTQNLVAIDDSGTELPLQQALFGIQVAQASTSIDVPEAAIAPSWTAGGPTTGTVRSATGRILILCSVQMQMVGNSNGGYVGIRRTIPSGAVSAEANLTPGGLNVQIPNLGANMPATILGIASVPANTNYRFRPVYGCVGTPGQVDCSVNGCSILAWPL